MLDKTFFNKYLDESTKVLKTMGLTIRWGHDFGVYGRLIAKHCERYPPALGFKPENYKEDKLDGVWLVAYRNTGELVHTQACRKITILPNMKTHLQTQATAYETENFKFNLENLEVNLSPDATKISGDAIYHGDAWLKGGPAGVRGGAALFILSRMMMAKALSLWDTDYIYGLIPPFAGTRGLAQRYGYTRCEQGAVTFTDLPTYPNDLWFVWLTAAEAQMQMRLGPRYFVEMMTPKEENVMGKVA